MPKDFYENINLPKGFNKSIVLAAYEFAKEKHAGQKRKSGEEYIKHPLAVARILLELGMSSPMIAAALLHDVVEDTGTQIKEIENEFGKEIAKLVEGVTNLGMVDFAAYSKEDERAKAMIHYKNENLRQLFLAMAEDVRVVVIKLADRLHNMQTIKYLPKADQERIAKETLNIFSPLALRLGMGDIKGKLEDLAFPIAFPNEYQMLKKEANRRYKAADRYVLHVKRLINDRLKEEGVEATVEGRAKHIYSLYRKITRPEINWDFSKIYDLVALRIITESVPDCYRILGIIHGMFRPLPNYIRDYIAAPKPNGYRSIHTSVFAPEGKVAEIQIRTKGMHEEAEFGVASHLHYSQVKESGARDEHLEKVGTFAKKSQTDFLKQIKEWQNNIGTAEDFVEGLKIEFLDPRIYVFSPMGDIYDLPVGATPVDFAYEVHSRVGDTCRGAKVNGKMVSLDFPLSTRDVVEIITQKNSAPKRDWLDFVKTSKAKQHIRGYFRKFDYEKHREEGIRTVEEGIAVLGLSVKEIPAKELKKTLSESSFKTIDDLYASVGAGVTTPRQAMKIILHRPFLDVDTKRLPKAPTGTKKEDFRGMRVRLAPCCEPNKNDKVISYITRGQGLTVHKTNCPNLKSLEKDRLFQYNPWVEESLSVSLVVVAENRVGLIRDVSEVISKAGVNIEKIKNRHRAKGKESYIDIVIAVEDISCVVNLIKKLGEIKGVKEIKKA